jgi:hypothetical protein
MNNLQTAWHRSTTFKPPGLLGDATDSLDGTSRDLRYQSPKLMKPKASQLPLQGLILAAVDRCKRRRQPPSDGGIVKTIHVFVYDNAIMDSAYLSMPIADNAVILPIYAS